jgi:hypothetical protein
MQGWRPKGWDGAGGGERELDNIPDERSNCLMYHFYLSLSIMDKMRKGGRYVNYGHDVAIAFTHG